MLENCVIAGQDSTMRVICTTHLNSYIRNTLTSGNSYNKRLVSLLDVLNELFVRTLVISCLSFGGRLDTPSFRFDGLKRTLVLLGHFVVDGNDGFVR